MRFLKTILILLFLFVLSGSIVYAGNTDSSGNTVMGKSLIDLIDKLDATIKNIEDIKRLLESGPVERQLIVEQVLTGSSQQPISSDTKPITTLETELIPTIGDEGWGDEEDEGWGDDEEDDPGEEEFFAENDSDKKVKKESKLIPKIKLPFQGFLRLTVSNHLTTKSKPKNLSTAQLALELEYDKKFARDFRLHFVGQAFHDFVYELEQRGNYHGTELDKLESGGKLKELWLSYSQDSYDLYIGRQIIVWGESDGLAITDLINPRDRSLLFFQTLEESRLGVNMARFNYYWGENTLSLITIGEFRPNKMPVEGTEFDFRPALLQSFSILPFNFMIGDHIKPEIGSRPEWGIRVMMPGEGYDVSFMAASLFDDDFVLSPSPNGVINLAHNRFDMYGFTANKLVEKFVLKIEAAYYHGKAYNRINPISPMLITPGNFLIVEDRDVINIAAGFDLTFNDNLSILFNQQYQLILNYDDYLLTDRKTLTEAGLSLAAGMDIVMPLSTDSTMSNYEDTSRVWGEIKNNF